MKFTKHQQDVISKIISGEVYDLRSYLSVYGKLHIEKYDMASLQKAFHISEEGKEYKVIKEGFSLFAPGSVQTAVGTFSISQARLSIPEDEYEMKPASFIREAPNIKYTYEDQEFDFNFCAGVSIVNNFYDVVDFITLLAYLKQEALILEVSKPIEQPDIGLFFEKTPKNQTDEKPIITVEMDEFKPAYSDVPFHNVLDSPPKRFAHEYADYTWSINEDHLLMCQNFLGKRYICTSSLITFAKKKFRTNEQVAQNNNFRVALVALIVSILSIAYGIISPLLQPQPIDILQTVSEQLTSIDVRLNELKNQELDQNTQSTTAISDILSALDDIKEILNSRTAPVPPNMEDHGNGQ